MGITQVITKDEFFTTVEPQGFQRGQLCWVPIPHPDPIPRILDVQRSSPEEHGKVDFELREANQKLDFRRRDRSLPIKHLNLRSNEELLAQRCKKRPAVILSKDVECFSGINKLLKQNAKRHQQQDCLFVVPYYRAQQEEFDSGIIQPIIARAKCLIYRQFFYMPPIKNFGEGIARFDRVQVVIDRTPAAIEPTDISLSREAYGLFVAMFQFCISGQPNETLEAAKALVRESYPDSG